jgi:hypothetical protein
MRGIILFISLIIAVLQPAASVAGAAVEAKYTALWSGESCSPGQRYEGIGDELKKLGVEINSVPTGGKFTETLLEGVDLVVFAGRSEYLSSEEQQLLVRYVQQGGSLLVICGQSGVCLQVINPVTGNFGLIIGATYSGSTKMTYFEHPASTVRRPVKTCSIYMPLLLCLNSGARNIGGRNFEAGPAAMESYLGMATRCGKGRVIAFSDDEAWQTYG